ncbi:hypothetical protein NLJ89_g3950 [Agrocybe chaxingu]|uniref:Uncharacterized protein n=1 Tax=Agrocybe chaxingu TaxID=84603 RepID=A0A9W8KAC6_9AGAR|nr:hypothetical protein NLJ89_g3950 [Agrocybe chaxingu]
MIDKLASLSEGAPTEEYATFADRHEEIAKRMKEHLVDTFPEKKWEEAARDKLSCATVTKAAEDVLKTLGLSKEASMEQVEKLGKLVCLCGHHDFRDPLNFTSLVYHSHTETLI